MFYEDTNKDIDKEEFSSGEVTDDIFSDTLESTHNTADIVFIEDDANTQREDKNNSEEKELSVVGEIYEWVEAVSYAMVIVIFVLTFLFRMVSVSGHSMNDTLHDEDRIIISHFMYEPKYKDIVVLNVDHPMVMQNPLIKRVIAIEGQKVDINRETGDIIVDGEVLDEPYILEKTAEFGEVEFPVIVGPGQVFVMGDNRNNSLDSRIFGPIDEKNIIGSVVLRIFPFDKIGAVD